MAWQRLLYHRAIFRRFAHHRGLTILNLEGIVKEPSGSLCASDKFLCLISRWRKGGCFGVLVEAGTVDRQSVLAGQAFLPFREGGRDKFCPAPSVDRNRQRHADIPLGCRRWRPGPFRRHDPYFAECAVKHLAIARDAQTICGVGTYLCELYRGGLYLRYERRRIASNGISMVRDRV